MTLDRANHRNKASRLVKLVIGACVTSCMMPATAQAFVMPDQPASPYSTANNCTPHRFEPAAAARPAAQVTKSSDILGGTPSALDMIRQQQGQLHPEAASTASFTNGSDVPAFASTSCLAAISLDIHLPAPVPAVTIVAPRSAEDFLGSSRVGIHNTPFNDDWQRVSSTSLASRNVETLLGGNAQVDLDTLSQVNRWANHRIQYTEDLANYGVRDYWATANETLQSGRGDCEDFAILKYQMLAALGFDRSQMFLTLARDLVRNSDHAVLIVRVAGRPYMLDNATDVLLPASVSFDYRPTLSFNTESAWLHGRTAPAALTYSQRPDEVRLSYLSDRALSSARVTGFSR
ncbi:transglutaminase-like cysteine peptidase [Aurantiacibacter gilvus]|uniref:Transglutaminase-like cysteine peptidase n=1 Tax=Aurantiacibacter gilvus TaxID=3139141 RepID=A0ABU9IB74_9SPHN